MTLAEWLEENEKTATWLAEQLGRDRSFVTKIKNGTAYPSLQVAAEIQRITDGGVTALDYPATLSSLPAFGRRAPRPARARP